ncbi:T9SS type A sorting domain-containing protein, partial [Nibrella saemangeumensis]|uniref:T9SS type A sorting domain-containing protein n=1 Tax=Nibrella saemangeumensis TaxID=1084526 RepID=UPI0031E67EB4
FWGLAERPCIATYHIGRWRKTRPSDGFCTKLQNYPNGNSNTFSASAPLWSGSYYHWEGLNGALVNGSTSVYGVASVNVSLTSNRGTVRVRTVDQCGNASAWNERQIGVPVITSATVNGGPPQYPNYVGNPAQVYVFTADTPQATSCSWSILNGNGSLYPSSFSCQVYAYDFAQVFAQVSNGCGLGDSFTFYISSSSGYLAYPNPANEELTVEFSDQVLAGQFLEEATLYDGSNVPVKNFNVTKAKEQKYFNGTKSVKFDVKDLIKGTYFLHIRIGQSTYKEQIFIK